MDWKFEKLWQWKMSKGMLQTSKIVLGLAVLALIGCGLYFLYQDWRHGSGRTKNLMEVAEFSRNVGLSVAGLIALWFAWQRIRLLDVQTAIAGKDDARKDKERIEERLEGAVRLLAEPTDSMKHFAITQLEQIAAEHPEQALGAAVACMCGQAKEYSPNFSEQEEASIRRVAAELGDRNFDEIHESWEDFMRCRDPEEPPESEPTLKGVVQGYFEREKSKRRDQRDKEMKGKLVGAINRLYLKARELDPSGGIHPNKEGPSVIAPVDLRGVDIADLTIRSLDIVPEVFGGCVFTEVTFQDCNFRGAFDVPSKFQNCRFENCIFEGVRFRRCSFHQPMQFDSSIVGSHFNECTFNDTHWESCDLTGANFRNIKMGCRDLEKEKDGLINKNKDLFVDCNLTGVKFHIGRGEIPSHLRWDYHASDFGTCFAKRPLPRGLDAALPKIRIEVLNKRDVKKFFDIIDVDSGRADE